MYHLHQFLRGRQRDMPQETIQVLDVVLRESPSWNYVTVSRSFFSTTFGHRGDIGEGLECWRGYYQSLRPTQMGLSLNIDISATSFFKPVTVIKFVEEFLNIRDTSRPLSDRDRVKIKKALRGVRIETSHQPDQIRRYKITGITPIPMSQLIFPIDEMGTRQTVLQYFWDKYNYRLKYGSWPCLQAGSDSRPVYLPMEVCKIVEGQRYSKKLNDKQVTNILRATCKRPQEREQSIRDMVLHNKYAEDRFAQEFGIDVSNDLVSVPARVLPPPMLRYHDSGREKTCAPSVGQWNMINKKMINGGTIDNWTCLNFSRMRPEEVQRFCMDLTHMCNATGMSVNPRPFVEVKSAAPNHIENALRDVHRRATQMLAQQGTGNQLQLLIVILPDVSGSYGKIKRVCETEIGIVSQCCLPRHASRPNKQYLENVALKINVKVGGRNTVLERAFVRNGIPYVSEVPTIIFGADVTHPPPGEDSASSIAAVVASMDWPEITKYRGLVSAQPHRQEIIEDLFTVSKDPQKGHNVNGGMIRELLIAFRRKTNRRPERIIFYRDGVSEGQFSHVLLHEMDAIRKACASLEEGYLPPVTFVVVQKRHPTRLFPEVHGRRDMTDKSGNILPGTVVDQKICHPTEFDFSLYSRAGIQLVASMDRSEIMSYRGLLCAQPHKQEIIEDLLTFSKDPQDGHTVNGVMIWDGESEGQFSDLLFHEINDTPKSCASLEGVYLPEGLSAYSDSEISDVDMVRLKLSIDSEIIPVCAKAGTPLGSAIYSILKEHGHDVSEFHYKSIPDGKPRGTNTPVWNGLFIEATLRLLGGNCNSSLTSLAEWIYRDFEYPLEFFECIEVVQILRTPAMPNHLICLGAPGLHILNLVLGCLETAHSQSRSYNGMFRLDDIYYDSDKKQVVIDVASVDISATSYKNDLVRVVSEVFDSFFRYEDEQYLPAYPMHVEDLVGAINGIGADDSYKSAIVRSLIYRHPATWSIAFQMGFISALEMKYWTGFSDPSAREDFEAILSTGVDKRCENWIDDVRVSCSYAQRKYCASEMVRLYQYRLKNSKSPFRSDYLGRLQYSRCALHHCKCSSLSMLAALYLYWKDQLPRLHQKLMVDYQDSNLFCGLHDMLKLCFNRSQFQHPSKRPRRDDGSDLCNTSTGFISIYSIPYKCDVTIPEILGYLLPPSEWLVTPGSRQ